MNALLLAVAMGISAPTAKALARIFVVEIALNGVPAGRRAAVLGAAAEIVGSRRRSPRRTRG